MNNENQSFNFLYEKIHTVCKTSALIPLNTYTASKLKNFDKKGKLSSEDIDKIVEVFNRMRSHYIEGINEETAIFLEKYHLNQKLNHKSEVFFYENLMNELGLSVEKLEEAEKINQIGNEEDSMLQNYLLSYINKQNDILMEENKNLKEELEKLREGNKLNLK